MQVTKLNATGKLAPRQLNKKQTRKEATLQRHEWTLLDDVICTARAKVSKQKEFLSREIDSLCPGAPNICLNSDENEWRGGDFQEP